MTALHIETPLLQHVALSRLLDMQVLLKMDGLQPSGSFTMRGIGKLFQNAFANVAMRFVKLAAWKTRFPL